MAINPVQFCLLIPLLVWRVSWILS